VKVSLGWKGVGPTTGAHRCVRSYVQGEEKGEKKEKIKEEEAGTPSNRAQLCTVRTWNMRLGVTCAGWGA
jgi:hypothetical protein